MKITIELLVEKNACVEARVAFGERFPAGADYQDVLNALAADDREEAHEWAVWLLDNIGRIDTVAEFAGEVEGNLYLAGSLKATAAIRVRGSLLVAGGIEAGWGIEAGGGIKAGEGIEAGFIPAAVEMEIRCKALVRGTVAYGTLIETEPAQKAAVGE